MVCAFGPWPLGGGLGMPSRNAILAGPPPKDGGIAGGGLPASGPPDSGEPGLVEMAITTVWVMFWFAIWFRNTVFGSSRIACVMVPAAMKGVRSCGMRGVVLSVAVWLLNLILFAGLPPGKGVMSTGSILGPPLTEAISMPWATIVVPCGIDAIRVTVNGSFGFVVGGTGGPTPGSKWVPGAGSVVTSLMVCR